MLGIAVTPQTGADVPSKRTITPALAYVAAILAAAAVAWLRLPAAGRGALWAEDGIVFIRDAMLPGVDLFAPYAGYLHVVPRAGAELVAGTLPLPWYGYGMNALSCLVVAGTAALVFNCSSAVSTSRGVRVALASVTILAAPAPIETLGNFANIHWYFLWLTPWLLVKRAATRPEGAMLFAAALLAALTEPLTLMFAPLFIYRAKDRGYWAARAGVAIGGIGQVITTLASPRPKTGQAPDLLSIAYGWVLNSSSPIIFGNSANIKHAVLSAGWLPIVAAAIPFLVAFAYAMYRGSSIVRIFACTLLAASVGIWFASQVVNFVTVYDYANFTAKQWQGFFITRYATPASMFLLALVPLAADSLPRRHWRPIVAIGILATQLAYFAPVVSGRQLGPDWAAGITDAAEVCAKDPASRPWVPVAPGQMRVQVPCARL